MTQKVLLVEDTFSLAMVYQDWLVQAGYECDHVETGKQALDMLAADDYRVALLDLQLPDMNGMEVLDHITRQGLPVSVVVVTASGSINIAVEAMRGGAYDFVVKPVARERLETSVRNAAERQVLRQTVAEIQHSYGDGEFHGFIGQSPAMLGVFKIIENVSASNASVFITGESGTGKEVCAEAIHRAGPRSGAAFVPLNCAAIPKDLIESEIFGHIKGAFTGATSDRDGAAAMADGGTLFLDEICEMDLGLQSKLLRFLQTGKIQKVGSDKLQDVNVRVICATNRDPMTEVAEGRFREDLFYRLYVVPVALPPLRERGDDILLLAREFLKDFGAEEGKSFTGFSDDAEDALLVHRWAGNVRELQNAIRNVTVLHDGELVEKEMLPLGSMPTGPEQASSGASTDALTRSQSSVGRAAPSVSDTPEGQLVRLRIGRPFEEHERDLIEATIDWCGGSIPKASRVLKMSPSTLYRKREEWAEN